MFQWIRRIKLDCLFVAIICILFGVTLLIWPTLSALAACYLLGGVLAVCGIVRIISYFTDGTQALFQTDLFLGLVFSVAGIWILLRPQSVGSLVFSLTAIVILLHGFLDVQEALNLRRAGYQRWWVVLLLGLVSIILALLSLLNPFESLTVLTAFIGASLIYDGVSEVWVIARASALLQDLEK